MKNIYVLLCVLCFVFNACGSCNRPPIEPGNTDTNIFVKDTIPEWMIVDSNFIENCVTYCSKNIMLDTNSSYSVFPFVVKDTSNESGLFAIVSLKRYDMLYINQLAVTNNYDHQASASLVTHLQIRDNYESLLFMIEPIEVDSILKMYPDIQFNSWGMFGSVQIRLDSVQSINLIELAKLVKNK